MIVLRYIIYAPVAMCLNSSKAVMDKRLTPSPWTTPMDYPNGLPKWTTLKWTTHKKSYFATWELPGTNYIKNISCYPSNIKS